ncbi:MAG: glycosyltransferase [Lachnospiraceae bacterium]|nr:glycosyltransferase [Lachnospiraceae bacterium]
MAEILVLDIAASKTGALSVLEDFYGYIRDGLNDPANDLTNDPDSAGRRDHWTFVTGVHGILEPVPERGISVIVRDDVKSSQAARLRFELMNGGKWINGLAPDIVFSLENMLPRGIKNGTGQVVYIHQPVGFQREKRFSLFKKNEREQALYQKFYHKLIIASAKRADRCVVQTGWMRAALLRDAGIPGDRVETAPPVIPSLSEYVSPGEFQSGSFFYPASDLPYKNHDVIDRACAILKERGYFPEVLYTKDRVIPREEVFAHYNRSTLLFPSYIETFGMPLAEARQFGNPIIAADTEFAREVLEGYENAYFFAPFDPEALAGLMKDVMEGRISPKAPETAGGRSGPYSKLVDIILQTDPARQG